MSSSCFYNHMSKSVQDQLASALGHRDEKPNIDLAIKIARDGNMDQVTELISLVENKKAALRHDAIKVLYEIGERNPDMISKHIQVFLTALSHNDNRMKWGAMTALSSISKVHPQLLAPFLVDIVKAMEEGSVITRDHGIYILCHVAKLNRYQQDCMALLLEQLEKAPVNQLPMYAEKTAEVIAAGDAKKLFNILKNRADVLDFPPKARRIEKLIRQINP